MRADRKIKIRQFLISRNNVSSRVTLWVEFHAQRSRVRRNVKRRARRGDVSLLQERASRLPCQGQVPLLSEEEVRRMNEEVKRTMEQDGTSKKGRGKYNDYTAEERAKIGKYAEENGPARAVRHFSKILDRKLPKTTARRPW